MYCKLMVEDIQEKKIVLLLNTIIQTVTEGRS